MVKRIQKAVQAFKHPAINEPTMREYILPFLTASVWKYNDAFGDGVWPQKRNWMVIMRTAGWITLSSTRNSVFSSQKQNVKVLTQLCIQLETASEVKEKKKDVSFNRW